MVLAALRRPLDSLERRAETYSSNREREAVRRAEENRVYTLDREALLTRASLDREIAVSEERERCARLAGQYRPNLMAAHIEKLIRGG
jgi:hypothetical protein